MITTRKRYSTYKNDYTVYRKILTTDDYGAQNWTYEEGGTVHTMFTPITNESTIKEYGLDVNDMLQAVIYEEDVSIRPYYRFYIRNTYYEVVKIEEWMTHRLITIRKVKTDG